MHRTTFTLPALLLLIPTFALTGCDSAEGSEEDPAAEIDLEGLWASTDAIPAEFYLRFNRPDATSPTEYTFTSYIYNEAGEEGTEDEGEEACWEVTRFELDRTGPNEYVGTVEGEGGEPILTMEFSPGSEDTIQLDGSEFGDTFETRITPAEERSFVPEC